MKQYEHRCVLDRSHQACCVCCERAVLILLDFPAATFGYLSNNIPNLHLLRNLCIRNSPVLQIIPTSLDSYLNRSLQKWIVAATLIHKVREPQTRVQWRSVIVCLV